MRNTADKIKGLVQKKPNPFINDEAYQLASLRYAPDMAGIIWEVKRALAQGMAPERSAHSSTSTFFLRDCEGVPIAVFKPYDFIHEVIAYRLDHRRFAGVPQTVFATIDHPIFNGKTAGSCQEFVKGSVTAVEINKMAYESFAPGPIRRIAALDIRILNEDRHSSNMLVVNNTEVVPIDHGFIFPQDHSQMHLAWINWAQTATPFSETELSYIGLLDPEEDRRMLIDEFFCDERLANRLFVSTVFLKLAAIYRFTPMSIGKLVARAKRRDKEISSFEFLLERLKDRNPLNWTLFSRYVYEEVERTLSIYHEKISK